MTNFLSFERFVNVCLQSAGSIHTYIWPSYMYSPVSNIAVGLLYMSYCLIFIQIFDIIFCFYKNYIYHTYNIMYVPSFCLSCLCLQTVSMLLSSSCEDGVI